MTAPSPRSVQPESGRSPSPVLFTTTRWMRSSSVQPDSEPCIERRCRETGDGSHIFCYANDPEVEGSLLDGHPEHLQTADFWLNRALAQFPEGTRVRITVEAAPARTLS